MKNIAIGWEEKEVCWHVVRTHLKHEEVASTGLRRLEGIEVYSPRIRLRRRRKGGTMWMTESLFPNYVFARFSAASSLNCVRFAHGVQTVVHFGTQIGTVPDEAIEDLRSEFSDDEIRVMDAQPEVGQEVVIQSGPFQGYDAVVVQTMPAQDRVRVLLEFMQREVEVGVKRDDLLVA